MRVFPKLLVFIATLSCAWRAWSQADFKVVTDQTSYNVGSEVRVEFIRAALEAGPEKAFEPDASREIVATIRYAGESQPLAQSVPVPRLPLSAGHKYTSGYRILWKVPLAARTGRYEIEIAERDPQSHRALWGQPHAASFTVYKKLVRIEEVKLDKTFYTVDDPVAVAVKLKNLARRPLSGLRVEFSKRYWPWIAQSSQQAGVDAVALAERLFLPVGAEKVVRSAHAAVAAGAKQPAVTQYAVVVWDGERKNVYDIAFSPLVFINPPGVDLPKPYAAPPGYPLQYLYPDLAAVNVSSYRHFYPPEFAPAAIELDRGHTMFDSGEKAGVKFTVFNRTPKPWQNVSVRIGAVNPDGSKLAGDTSEELTDLDAGASVSVEMGFPLPAQATGIYRGQIEVSDGSGQILATKILEMAVNPLPKSILIFCAHEDDEGAHRGIIRAAVENHIPIHFVYFTSGDSGSCDRYYQHSCGPAEALNFGGLRMEEARASLGHLGVARDDIFFLGLPDGGSGQIWSNHIDPSNPYLAVLLATDHAPYEGLARANLPYARNSVVEMVKEFIKKFQPEVIYTGHPDERHVDHRTNNWFVVEALQKLLREGSVSADLKLLVDQVYGPGPQANAPYHYQKHVLHVSGEAMALAQEAEWFYQSQDGNRAEGRLRTFNELPRSEVHWQVLDWKDHEGWNEKH